MGAASYVTGSHNFRGRRDADQRRLAAARSVDRRRAADHLQRRPAGVGDAASADRSRNGIKRDLGLFLQDRWTMGRITLNLGLRYDQFIGETRESEVLPSRFNAGAHVRRVPGRQGDPGERAPARCRTGRTSRRASASRWTCSATAAPRSRRASRATSPARRSPFANAGQPGRRADGAPTRARGPTSTATACRSTPTATSSSTSSAPRRRRRPSAGNVSTTPYSTRTC